MDFLSIFFSKLGMEDKIYCFWTGTNEMSENRKRNLQLLKDISGQIQPNNQNMDVKPIDFGRYIALLYICKDIKDPNKTGPRKIIYKICNENKSDANKIQNFFNNTLKLIKE